jgi:arsenate reductase (glutaredoxin)
LTAQGVEFESVNYIEKPFSASELKGLLDRAGLKPEDALRRNEAAYKQLVAGKDLSDDEVLKLMALHPELVQRPIVVRDDKAVLARPVENLTKLGL